MRSGANSAGRGQQGAGGSYLGGYSYSPYGEARSTGTNVAVSTNNNLRYIAGYYDVASGLYKLGARFYDPTLGRFTQFDPSGQESNPFGYANCNPLNSKDPSGLASCSDLALAQNTAEWLTWGAGATAAVAAATGAGAPVALVAAGFGISTGAAAIILDQIMKEAARWTRLRQS